MGSLKQVFKGYEYKKFEVNNSLAQLYNDYLPNFGWEVVEETSYNPYKAKFHLKRDRFLENKKELQRLQRIFEYKASTIDKLEKSKRKRALIYSLTVGLLGTVFMTLSVFSYLSSFYFFTVLLAIPAFSGWVSAYFIYKKVLYKKIDELNPQIEEQYKDIYFTGKKAFSLLIS